MKVSFFGVSLVSTLMIFDTMAVPLDMQQHWALDHTQHDSTFAETDNMFGFGDIAGLAGKAKDFAEDNDLAGKAKGFIESDAGQGAIAKAKGLVGMGGDDKEAPVAAAGPAAGAGNGEMIKGLAARSKTSQEQLQKVISTLDQKITDIGKQMTDKTEKAIGDAKIKKDVAEIKAQDGGKAADAKAKAEGEKTKVQEKENEKKKAELDAQLKKAGEEKERLQKELNDMREKAKADIANKKKEVTDEADKKKKEAAAKKDEDDSKAEIKKIKEDGDKDAKKDKEEAKADKEQAKLDKEAAALKEKTDAEKPKPKPAAEAPAAPAAKEDTTCPKCGKKKQDKIKPAETQAMVDAAMKKNKEKEAKDAKAAEEKAKADKEKADKEKADAEAKKKAANGVKPKTKKMVDILQPPNNSKTTVEK